MPAPAVQEAASSLEDLEKKFDSRFSQMETSFRSALSEVSMGASARPPVQEVPPAVDHTLPVAPNAGEGHGKDSRDSSRSRRGRSASRHHRRHHGSHHKRSSIDLHHPLQDHLDLHQHPRRLPPRRHAHPTLARITLLIATLAAGLVILAVDVVLIAAAMIRKASMTLQNIYVKGKSLTPMNAWFLLMLKWHFLCIRRSVTFGAS